MYNQYRITKYNPIYRDSTGAYMKDEWISFGQIGDSFNGKIFSLEEYIDVENKYIESIFFILDYFKTKKLKVITPEYNNRNIDNSGYNIDLIKLYKLKPKCLDTETKIKNYIRLILRGDLWASLKLKSKKAYIEFGYDYYMYVKTTTKLPNELIKYIENLGLFIEPL